MSPSRMGRLHLGHGPNVSGRGGGFRSGSGICTLEGADFTKPTQMPRHKKIYSSRFQSWRDVIKNLALWIGSIPVLGRSGMDCLSRS
jgi:hypothetical protein